MYYYVNIGQLLLDEKVITKEQLETLSLELLHYLMFILVPSAFIYILRENRNLRLLKDKKEIWETYKPEPDEIEEYQTPEQAQAQILKLLHENRMLHHTNWKRRETYYLKALKQLEANIPVNSAKINQIVDELLNVQAPPGTDCLFCYDAGKDEAVIILPCSQRHTLHKSCLRKWLLVKKTYPVCPFCFDSISFLERAL